MKKRLFTGLLLSALCIPSVSLAGVYTDDLTRCVVSNTDSRAKTDLVKWVFAIATLHPEVEQLSTVSAAQRTSLDKSMAAIVQRLLLQSCREQAKAAIKFEGNAAVSASFEVLGKIAMQELMSNPKVSAGFASYVQYLDRNAFENLKK